MDLTILLNGVKYWVNERIKNKIEAPITPEDEGKFLRVIEGRASWVEILIAEDNKFGGQ